MAAFGGFGIPVALAISNSLFGDLHFALVCFGVFHLSCLFATWWWYYRRDAEVSC